MRRAWRRLSLKFHPDKVAHLSDEERAKAAHAFALLKEAHEVIGHESTRREYDQMMGVDELLADTDFDLADMEAALARVAGIGGRRCRHVPSAPATVRSVRVAHSVSSAR